jgi:protein-tyrosine-phosphatase
VPSPTVEQRAARHAALGDPVSLAMADALAVSDLAPVELQERFGISSNLLAHHLDVMEDAGLISRSRSSGDGRRRYVRLLVEALDGVAPGPSIGAQRVLFVCTANSARSQLAAALWRELAGAPAESAGTHPAAEVAPGAVAAARRFGLELSGARPKDLRDVGPLPRLVVTVCDRAHEELASGTGWRHWSVPDPVPAGTKRAFDATVLELRERMRSLLGPERLAS